MLISHFFSFYLFIYSSLPFLGGSAASTVHIESLPCTKYNSICQANVVLTRRLEPGRYYDFKVSVKDTKGGKVVQSCSIAATNFTTPHDVIFPHKPGIVMIPEVSFALLFLFVFVFVCNFVFDT